MPTNKRKQIKKTHRPGVQVGSLVKIVRKGERFWNKIKKIKNNRIQATVANDLVVYKKKFGDPITFNKSDIIDVQS